MRKRTSEEHKDPRKNTEELIDAIVYELWNHEYIITFDPTDALAAVGLTPETLDPEIWEKVFKKYREQADLYLLCNG